MQNFSQSKSCYPYELAQLCSSLFPLFLCTAMACHFVSRHRMFTNAWHLQTRSWTFVLLAPHRCSLPPFLWQTSPGWLSGSDIGLLTFCCPFLSPHPFFLFGLHVPRVFTLDLLFGSIISWTTLCYNKWFLFVLFMPKAIAPWVSCTQAVPWARTTLECTGTNCTMVPDTPQVASSPVWEAMWP